jgi:flagellar biosynthesis/type III secretory pathway chaperone
MSWEDLSTVLWKERELLELLLFKIEEEQLVLASGRTRWLAHATREVEVVLAEIREHELLRAIQVHELATASGFSSTPSLTALAGRAPEPWGELLLAHRQAFLALTAEISSIAEANRDLLAAGAKATREALMGMERSVGTTTYGRQGQMTAPTGPRVVDRAL